MKEKKINMANYPSEEIKSAFANRISAFIKEMKKEFGDPCWDVKNCGRQKGGPKSEELCVCSAYPWYGWSCWNIAGTLCGGIVQGSIAQKEGNCQMCRVYQDIMKNDPSKLMADSRYFSEIMQNLNNGIFTMSLKGVIDFRCSKAAQEILGIDISGKILSELLLKDKEDRALFSNWLSTVEKAYPANSDWELFSSICPLDVIAFKGRNLRFSFYPFIREKKLFRLLVEVNDISKEVKLKIELEKERRHNAQIVEIVKDLDYFEEFIVETYNIIDNVEELLKSHKGYIAKESLIEVYRAVHSIKGSSGIFKLDEILKETDAFEEYFRNMMTKANNDNLEKVKFESIEKMNKRITRIRKILGDTADYISKITNKDFGVTRGEVRDIKLSVTYNQLSDILKKVKKSSNNELKKNLKNLLKVPAGKLFSRFPKMISNLAEKFQKEIELRIEGGNVRINAHVLNLLGDPVVHLIRNAVDHGIETPDERRKQGKTAKAIIKLKAVKENGNIRIIVKDDGRGIDPEIILKTAVNNNIIKSIAETGKMKKQEIYSFLYLPGFSTKEKATTISGRGIWMNVVKNNIENKLNGSISIKSKKNKGTTFIISVANDSNHPDIND